MWIEIIATVRIRNNIRSLPAWGVWIEIIGYCIANVIGAESLPAWGVWIEILQQSFYLFHVSPLPAWGVWIEI